VDRRDKELLAKQLRAVAAPRNDGLVGLVVLAVFVIGIAVGGALFTRDHSGAGTGPFKSAVQRMTDDVTGSIARP
jgi:uncharacterized membrane protein